MFVSRPADLDGGEENVNKGILMFIAPLLAILSYPPIRSDPLVQLKDKKPQPNKKKTHFFSGEPFLTLEVTKCVHVAFCVYS